jgi:signal transduction histidine kinase
MLVLRLRTMYEGIGAADASQQSREEFLMKAAVIHALGQLPRFEDFPEPTAGEGKVGVNVRAAGLHPIVRAQASGANSGSANGFPLIPGIDGVGYLNAGTRVYFFAQDLLTQAQARLDRLSRMVTGLLDVTGLQASSLVERPARTDLRSIVCAAVDEQRELAPSQRIRLHLPARTPILVWADADRVHQVVTTLLTNALKYAPPDQPVDVRVRRQVRWAHISIRD